MRIALIDPELAALVRNAQEKAVEILYHLDQGYTVEQSKSDSWELFQQVWEIQRRAKGKARYLNQVRDAIDAVEKAAVQEDAAAFRIALTDLLYMQLLGVEEELDRYAAQHVSVDGELLAATDDHMRAGRFQDAIRAAFPVLTARLRILKRNPKERDGQALVNELFGGSGHFVGRIDTEELNSIRNLLAGLYGMVRNYHAHNAGGARALEAQGVISLMHHLLTGPLAKAKKAKPKRKRTSTPKDPVAPSTP